MNWQTDPILVNAVLQIGSRDLDPQHCSSVQLVLRKWYIEHQRELEAKKSEARRMELLWAVDPRRYKNYITQLEANKELEEEGEIEYGVPETNEDAMELERLFMEATRQHQELLEKSLEGSTDEVQSLDFGQFADGMSD